MATIDYYKILGLASTATDDEIRKSYRKLARKFHPDLNPTNKDAEQKFKEINEANEVLSDPEKRKKYDTYGKDWKHGDEFEKARQQQQQSSRGYSNTDFGSGDYSDFFESMFGSATGGRRRQSKFRGEDQYAELHLKLSDVFTKHQQTVSVNGKNIRLTIPAGVENGQTIKIKGHGSQGLNGGSDGDLVITFAIQNDTRFKRDGNNLQLDVNLDLYTAVLGGEVFVDTFDGKVKLKVAPGTQPGTKVKLKGKGFPVYKKDDQFGDLFITYTVKLPVSLTAKEKQLFNELKKLSDDAQ